MKSLLPIQLCSNVPMRATPDVRKLMPGNFASHACPQLGSNNLYGCIYKQAYHHRRTSSDACSFLPKCEYVRKRMRKGWLDFCTDLPFIFWLPACPKPVSHPPISLPCEGVKLKRWEAEDGRRWEVQLCISGKCLTAPFFSTNCKQCSLEARLKKHSNAYSCVTSARSHCVNPTTELLSCCV